ncbi:hypothetical protein K438DRAFT_1763972 [Mycena galopus ATCC 62051]|nr:hypothetical protein K438DRAFT_1763972 [Mycena galopus ATCC 62051]
MKLLGRKLTLLGIVVCSPIGLYPRWLCLMVIVTASRVAKTKAQHNVDRLTRSRFFSRGLVNAAHSHQFDHIKEELLTDPRYVDLLAPVAIDPKTGQPGVHAPLSKYRTRYHISTKFDGNSTMLEDLFTFLIQGSCLAAVSARPIAIEALAVVGL